MEQKIGIPKNLKLYLSRSQKNDKEIILQANLKEPHNLRHKSEDQNLV